MNRIEKKFRQLKRNKQKAFIAFITAGYPNLKTTEKLVKAFAHSGVDLIELGVPFSDPMADGPIIQAASEYALKHKVNLYDILKLVKQLRKNNLKLPLALMSYYNPIFCFGEERFIKQAVSCGVDGVIIPDLPVEEGRSFMRLANKYHLDTICFISPTTSFKRIKFISSVAKGFIYYVSLTGVTGIRERLAADLIKNLKLIKRVTHKPVCVGFGVSREQQVRQIYRVADGVVVGSAIVKKIKENLSRKDLVARVAGFVSYLKNV